MVHYHVERKHDDNEAFSDFKSAVLFVVSELNEGLAILVARRDFEKAKTVVDIMHNYTELGSWEINSYDGEGSGYRELGDRSWNITECNSYRCSINGGSW